jgi:hypothetical protein
MIFLPVLYGLLRLSWGLIPLDKLPQILALLVEDFLGPAFFMSLIIFISVNVLWRIPKIDQIVQFLFGTKPDIQGTWQGRLSYEFEGKNLEKMVYLVIKQINGYSIDIWLLTDERISSSTFAEIGSYQGSQRIY